MLRISSVLLASSLLGACAVGSYPKDVGELKAMSASSPLVTSSQYRIERPLAEVTASLEKLAQKCLNTLTEARMQYRHSLTGGGGVMFKTRYETTVKQSGKGVELAMRMIPVKGAMNESKDGGIIFAALAESAGTASDVTHYYGRFNGGDFSDVVANWAKGTGRGCPEMPR